MDLDVKKLMLVLLERQKEYVLEDLESYSCAMVAVFAADGQSYLTFPKFEDEISKIEAYASIVKRAKLIHAAIIITVNAARYSASTGVEEIDDYRWGDFDETNSRPCILLTASGPDVESCSLQLGYEIAKGKVLFDQEPEMLYRIMLNLLPDWPGRESRVAN